MNRFQVVWEALGELSTYGEHASENPNEMEAVKAFRRIEEEHRVLRETLMDMRDMLAEARSKLG